MDVCLHLRAENLKSKDLIGKSDPYFQVFFPKESEAPIYQSEVIKNVTDPAWVPAEFSLPKSAFMRSVRIKIMDKDRLTKDDLILDCEIRYPFRQNNFVFGAWASDDKTEARLCVLNDDGDEHDDSKSGKAFSTTADKIGAKLKDILPAKHFKVYKLGKGFMKMKK